MNKNDAGAAIPTDPAYFQGEGEILGMDQGFRDFLSGRASIDPASIAFESEQSENPLRWAAALIRAHVSDDDKDQQKLAIAHDLEVAARGYGDPRILPLNVPKKRNLRRGERQDQVDADVYRQILILSVYAEHGRRKRKGSILDLALDNGLSEDQWRKWSSKTDRFLRSQSRETGMLVTYQGHRDSIPPAKWAEYVAIVHALMTANVRWAR